MCVHLGDSMSHDACPKCGGRKRTKNRQCASCRGYGRGRHIMPSGYVRVWCPGHPIANADGYALEHRRVLHDAGVDVPAGHHVHHLNEDKTDNRIEPFRADCERPRPHSRRGCGCRESVRHMATKRTKGGQSSVGRRSSAIQISRCMWATFVKCSAIYRRSQFTAS
jgi:hypothetical protein